MSSFFRLVTTLRIKSAIDSGVDWWVFENVTSFPIALLEVTAGKCFNISHVELNSADYGFPVRRRRLYVVLTRKLIAPPSLSLSSVAVDLMIPRCGVTALDIVNAVTVDPRLQKLTDSQSLCHGLGCLTRPTTSLIYCCSFFLLFFCTPKILEKLT